MYAGCGRLPWILFSTSAEGSPLSSGTKLSLSGNLASILLSHSRRLAMKLSCPKLVKPVTSDGLVRLTGGLLNTFDPAQPLEDDMQVQCLPVHQADKPQWTYREVPKVSSFRSFERVPSWCRRPQPFTYHVCAEDLAKTVLVPNLPEGDLQILETGRAPFLLSRLPGINIVLCVLLDGVHRSSFYVVSVRIGVT